MAWLALTSSSAAAQARGGQLRTPSSSGQELGPLESSLWDRVFCLLDQPPWWRDSKKPAGAHGLGGLSRAAQGPR